MAERGVDASGSGSSSPSGLLPRSPPSSAHLDSMKVVKALPPRRLPFFLPAVVLPLSISLIVHPLVSSNPHSLPALEASFGFSLLALLASLYVVPALGPAFVAKGFKGRDMLKIGGADV